MIDSKQGFAFFAVVFLVGTIFASSVSLAQAAGTFSSQSALSVKQTTTPSFQTYYGSDVNTYWPVLGDQEACEDRTDLLLQVPPAGCQPAVVRSDLLAEQNVPVFCQIDAVNINPLIDINQISNIQFRGEYPPEVVGAGFHPARAALRTYDTLLGSPLVNNIGYVVVVLKRQGNESALPDHVNVSLTAEIEYSSGNAYGIGRSEFVLEPTSQDDWETEKTKQSFWGGRYFVRLEQADANFADISIYQGDQRVITTRVNRGETSNKIYVPGMYCRAGLQISYDDYIAAQKKARIEVSSGNEVDSFDVYEGSRFLDDRCTVGIIEIDETTGETGKVIGSCNGEDFELVLGSRSVELASNKTLTVGGNVVNVESKSGVFYVNIESSSVESRRGKFYLDENNSLFKLVEGGTFIRDSNANFAETIRSDDKEWFSSLYNALFSYKYQTNENNVTNATISDQYFYDSIYAYEEVADDYPREEDGKYGQEALVRAIDLARTFGKDQTRLRLIGRYLDIYPNGQWVQSYLSEEKRLKEFDSSLAGEAIDFDDATRVVRLVSLSQPSKLATASLSVEGRELKIGLSETKDLIEGLEKRGEIKLDELDVDEALVSAYCMTNLQNGSKTLSTDRGRYSLDLYGQEQDICGLRVRLDDADLQEVAKIRLTPSAEGTRTEANLTVGIGIEKRAIELTPDKVRKKLDNLNETIEKWQNIVDKLGEVVKGMKTACFATAAALTFKNFVTGLSGEVIARQEVMNGDNGWTQRCKQLVPSKYPTLETCFLEEASNIDKEVAATTTALNKVNERINQIQSDPNNVASSDIFGKSVNTDNVRLALAQEIRSSCAGSIDLGEDSWTNADGSTTKTISASDIVSDSNVQNGLISTDAMRSILLDCELRKQNLAADHLNNVNSKLRETATSVNQQMLIQQAFEKNKAGSNGEAPAFRSVTEANIIPVSVVRAGDQLKAKYPGVFSENVTYSATYIGDDGKKYILGLREDDPAKKIYTTQTVWKEGGTLLQDSEAREFIANNSIGSLRSFETLSYKNKIIDSDRVVRYYETEPYKGMPAVVPFDVNNGWYAATKQTLPMFGGIGAYDSSGRVTSFWIGNVGENGRIEINTGYGDDLVQQINLNTGQPLESFPGLSQSQANDLVQRAQRAIESAAKQYGNQYIDIPNGERLQVGEPEVGTPGTKCQDFMSPKDCHLMFNVCDPVICPSSRCDFGGKYRVANVVQTGIIGSIFLCLPNIQEKILIPVCLTGIHAGIEGLLSIMKNYRDCLQENLDTGEMTGICDQIYSIYLCEFFWNQIAPFVNVIIPKLIEFAYGQGVRGGAEYLSVMSAWQNMENSINYFTNSYAVNSIEAFQARNVEEVGSYFCKAFISAKSPKSLESLIEPDSPPQFHAWFDQRTYSDVTVPATSQYKVFYHIFAGNDQGVSYNVYLKNPPASGYYSIAPTVAVASGYIAKGEYASETKDFTAPEGYQELCVRINDDEECGFGQVSTSFAVNEIRDAYVNSELTNTNIQSETECISGSNNLGALLQPNLQSGVEELISPDIYNRGVIRICSSANPGSQTDPKRFVNVGYCDDPKIICWLDQRSVENAITQANVGLKNETYQALEDRVLKALQEDQAVLLDNSTFDQKIQEFELDLEELKGAENKEAAASPLLEKINALFGVLFWNSHKARLLLVKGDVYAYMASYYKAGDDAAKRRTRTISEPADSGGTIVSSASSATTTVKGITGFIGSSINMFNEYDFEHCSEAVEKAKANGAPAVNLAPTFFAVLDNKNNVQQFLIGEVQGSAIKHVPVTTQKLEQFSEDMYNCMKTAYDNNMVISTHLQVDIESGSQGEAWRNGYVFNPTERISGFSYKDILLEPMANAALKLNKDVQFDFAMQGEMGGTLFDYSLVWKNLVDEYKSKFKDYKNARVGINFNFNTLSGNAKDWNDLDWFNSTQPTGPAHNRPNFQLLINSVDFAGFSAYEKTQNPTTNADLSSHIADWESKFKRNGIIMPTSLPWKLCEYGLGGGADVGTCSTTGETPNRCPWEGPLQLKEKACPTLWVGANKDLRYSYYKALVDFMSYGGNRIDSAYLWNLDTWDVQGIYNGLLDNSESCRDEQIVTMIKTHNSKFSGFSYAGQSAVNTNSKTYIYSLEEKKFPYGFNLLFDGQDAGIVLNEVSGSDEISYIVLINVEYGLDIPVGFVSKPDGKIHINVPDRASNGEQRNRLLFLDGKSFADLFQKKISIVDMQWPSFNRSEITDNFCELCGIEGGDCDADECSALGNCYFVNNLLFDECHFCGPCTGYAEKFCANNVCGKSCAWAAGDNLCIASEHSIIASVEGVPCLDGEARLKVDLGASGSYGLSNVGVLQWYLNSEWINVRSDAGKWNEKTTQEKEWVIQVEDELKGYKQNGNYLECAGNQLSFADRFEIKKENGQYVFYYHSTKDSILENTELFVKDGTLVIARTAFGNKIGNVGRQLNLLKSGEAIVGIKSDFNDVKIFEGTDKEFMLCALDGVKIVPAGENLKISYAACSVIDGKNVCGSCDTGYDSYK